MTEYISKETEPVALVFSDSQIQTQHLLHIANDLARAIYGLSNDLLVDSLENNRGGMEDRNRDFLRAVQARVNVALGSFAEVVPPTDR